MIHPDMNIIKKWGTVKISQLGDLLKSEGFHFVKAFSTDEHRIFVSEDNSLMIIFERNVGKVYNTKDRKSALHSFSVVSDTPESNNMPQ